MRTAPAPPRSVRPRGARRPGAAARWVALCAALFAAGPALGAPPDDPYADPAADAAAKAEKQRRAARALALHDEARALYKRGQYRAAIVRLEEAVALDPEGKELVYNLAVLHEKLAEIEAAERYYRRYLAMEREPRARAEVEAVLERLEGAKRELAPAPAPGAPERAAAARAAPAPAPAAPPDRAPSRVPWIVVSGGVAAGAFVLGHVLALAAIAQDPGSDARTGPGVRADAEEAHRNAVIAEVAFLVTGIAGATTLYLALTAPRARAAAAPSPRAPAGAGAPAGPRPAPRPEAGVEAGVSIGPAGAAVRVRF